jgi:hypothetical protein
MKVIENVTQKGGMVDLENTLFINCRFEDCVLVYAGGEVMVRNSEFKDCPFMFVGAAGTVVRALQMFGWGPQQPKILRPI